MPDAPDAIDELVAHAPDSPELRKFHRFHRQHPQLLDFLVTEIRLRIEAGFAAFSFHSLWQYSRWKLELQRGAGDNFLINDNMTSLYGRAITILHPSFNGRATFRKSVADRIFGTRIEPVPPGRPKRYVRKLEWADGAALESGWRPQRPHVPTATVDRKPDIHERG